MSSGGQAGGARGVALGAVLVLATLGLLTTAVVLYEDFVVETWPLERRVQELVSRSEALARRASSIDQRRLLRELGAQPGNGRFFRFDERLDEARVVGPEQPRRGTPGELLSFDYEDGDVATLLPQNGSHRIRDGVLHLDASRVLISRGELGVERDSLAEIELRLRVSSGTELVLAWSRLELDDWRSGRLRHEEAGRLSVPLVADGQFHTYRIEFGNKVGLHLAAGDTIRTLFLIPSDSPEATVEVDYVRLFGKERRFAGRLCGRVAETKGHELRQTIHCEVPAELVYQVDVPLDEPVLSVGLGVLESDRQVGFEITLDAGQGERTVLSKQVDQAGRWHDASATLSQWAGRTVELVFRVKGAANVAFWANPLLRGRAGEPRNVIILLEDTLRADHLTPYGYPLDSSPVRQELARSGVVFEHAFSQATKTRPSCPSLMTSLYPTATGVWNFQDRLDERYLTLAEILRNQGYRTASFTQNGNAGAFAGLHQGFSQVFGPSGIGKGPEEIYGPRVAEWLAAHRDEGFFLYLHLLDPHGPYDPPEAHRTWYERLPPGQIPLEHAANHDPPWVEQATLQGRRMLYAGEVRNNDSHLQSLLTVLDELQLRRNTLLVLLSDHGEHLGERGLWEHTPPGFAQVLHVPLIMSLPGKLPEGARIRPAVQLVDVLPTILELLDIPSESLLLQGDSLVSLVRGERASFWRNRVLWSDETMSYPSKDTSDVWGSLFFRRWHLLRSPRLRRVEVFDFVADPQESLPREQGLLARRASRGAVELMHQIKQANMAIWRSMIRNQAEAIVMDPRAREELRALGYIE